MSESDLIGLLLLVAGAALALHARKREFDRTNAFGIERFPAFGARLRSKSGDYVLLGGAIASLGTGAIVLASNHIDTWG